MASKAKATKPDTCRLTATIRGEAYAVRPVRPEPPGVTRAWRITKADGTADAVADTADGPTCDCRAFTFRRRGRDTDGCKHIRAMRALGLIDADSHARETDRFRGHGEARHAVSTDANGRDPTAHAVQPARETPEPYRRRTMFATGTDTAAAEIPPAVAAACEAFTRAVEAARVATGTQAEDAAVDDAVERAEDADRAMIRAMRDHGVKACVVGGRLYLDSWSLTDTPGDGAKAGACVVGLAEVKGL